jgi:hypothetical protein
MTWTVGRRRSPDPLSLIPEPPEHVAIRLAAREALSEVVESRFGLLKLVQNVVTEHHVQIVVQRRQLSQVAQWRSARPE